MLSTMNTTLDGKNYSYRPDNAREVWIFCHDGSNEVANDQTHLIMKFQSSLSSETGLRSDLWRWCFLNIGPDHNGPIELLWGLFLPPTSPHEE